MMTTTNLSANNKSSSNSTDVVVDLEGYFEKVRNVSHQNFCKLLEQSNPTKLQDLSIHHRPRMHKLSPQLRAQKKTAQERAVYDPIMVSLGPYHHGQPNFSQAQAFKYLCLHWCSGENEMKKSLWYNMILHKIDDIRDCYADASAVSKFQDQDLALMMLLDACFIVNFMENNTHKASNNWQGHLGVAAAISFTARDIMVLENQIPFFVLKMIISRKYDKKEGRELLQDFLHWMLSVKLEQAVIPKEDANPPLHLLEACWRVIAEKQISDDHLYHQQPINSCFRFLRPRFMTSHKKRDDDNDRSNRLAMRSSYTHMCPSVTDLKSKGIILRPSCSHTLTDIEFKSYKIYGELRLPVRHVSDQTQVTLSNMIAYEMSPDTKSDLAVLSYTNFIKSLIETPEDVKELQDRGIFRINRFASREQVVELFKSIDTFGLSNEVIYEEVIYKVGEHCSSKAKTWIAELFQSNLKNPWTITALLVAILLVILTFLQTYYTINPV